MVLNVRIAEFLNLSLGFRVAKFCESSPLLSFVLEEGRVWFACLAVSCLAWHVALKIT